jgi:long-subunit acyl-CoA synthetase (AMP-forming)
LIYFRGLAAGIYTTNSPEACRYCAVRSRANIIVVEDRKQLDKILEIKNWLPELKAIVQYDGKPEVEGVISVRNKRDAKRPKCPFILNLYSSMQYHNSCYGLCSRN